MIGKLIEVLLDAEKAMYADWAKRSMSDCGLEKKIGQLLYDESKQYQKAMEERKQEQKQTVCIDRDETAWQALVDIVDVQCLWQQQNLLRQIEAVLASSAELVGQAKKSYPYSEEQLFLEGLLHEKKKSRRKVDEILRYTENRIWEQIGFAPYTY